MIYKLVSSSQTIFVFPKVDLPMPGHTEGVACFNSLKNVVAHSSLFRVCKQTRAEGLPLFYQHHIFELSVEHTGCFFAIYLWLLNIGDLGCGNIRDIQIRFMTKCCAVDKVWMNRIHNKVSDQATVRYISKAPKTLWTIGQDFSSSFPPQAPVFEFDSQDPTLASFYTDFYAQVPHWRSYARYGDSLQYSMVFYPG